MGEIIGEREDNTCTGGVHLYIVHIYIVHIRTEMWPQTLQKLRRTSIAVREAPSAPGPECLRIQDLRV